MSEELNKEPNKELNKKQKYQVPVLSFKEFIEMEKGNKLIRGPFKIKAEDADIAMEYFKKR